MQDLKFEGLGHIYGGEYGTVSVEGMAKCVGDLIAATLSVQGVLRCNGSIHTGTFDCEGMAKIQGNIHADKIVIAGILTVSGGKKIEANKIVCEGIIRFDGELSADHIDSDGLISADSIVGDFIRIRSRSNRFLSLFQSKHSNIRLIEATTIDLRGVIANTVNGKDIYIDRGCRIENLDCSGTLYIDRDAWVGTVTGDYTKRNA